MIGIGFWATGITVKWRASSGWAASLSFLDNGFCNDEPEHGAISTQGKLHTRYYVDGPHALTAAIDAVRSDAERMGITFRSLDGAPSLYVDGDGEDPDVELPSDWRAILDEQASRLGWASYAQEAVG